MELNIDGKTEGNWLLFPKMTWGIWEIFTRARSKVWKLELLLGPFNENKKMYELKIYREVMSHDNEEWCKIWRWLDLSVQNWHEEVSRFWQKDSKISKIFAF